MFPGSLQKYMLAEPATIDVDHHRTQLNLPVRNFVGLRRRRRLPPDDFILVVLLTPTIFMQIELFDFFGSFQSYL